jgi:hypothetical protein
VQAKVFDRRHLATFTAKKSDELIADDASQRFAVDALGGTGNVPSVFQEHGELALGWIGVRLKGIGTLGWGDWAMCVRFWGEITREPSPKRQDRRRAFHPKARSHCPITPTKEDTKPKTIHCNLTDLASISQPNCVYTKLNIQAILI